MCCQDAPGCHIAIDAFGKCKGFQSGGMVVLQHRGEKPHKLSWARSWSYWILAFMVALQLRGFHAPDSAAMHASCTMHTWLGIGKMVALQLQHMG